MKIKDYEFVAGSFRLHKERLMQNLVMNCSQGGGRLLVDTGVSYNVDHILGKCYPKEYDVMTKFGVDHLKDFDFYLTNHLRFLKRDKVEFALVHFYEDGWKDLIRAMKADPRIDQVGVSNFNIDQLKEYYEEFGEYPCVNEFEFSRTYHDMKLVNFCNDNGIEMLGYGVLGGIHASKIHIREYTLEDLIGFAVNNNVTPIFRSDNQEHLEKDWNIYQIASHGGIKVRDLDGIDHNYSYGLTADNKDPRALNKFRYDKPHNALNVSYHLLAGHDEQFRTLDSYDVFISGDREVIPISNPDLTGYTEIPRDFMMITDYLVREKFKMNEKNTIITSDDMLWNPTIGKFYSFIMVSEVDGKMIKSGSESAKVYKKEFTYPESKS